jgi:glycosyltransferase involved in cell wall biosynthesis
MMVHDIIPELFPEYLNNCRKKKYWKLTRKAIQEADKIIAISSRTEKDLIQHLGIEPERISVNYIDVDEIYKSKVQKFKSSKVLEKYGLREGYILGGGGLEVRKNIEGLIRAYNLLLESNKKTHLIKDFPKLVISGKLMPKLVPLVTDTEKLVKKLNLTAKVKLLDFVPQEDLPALYKNALMFVYPSLYEGFGLPILEAMNMGTPVITSKKSSLPEVGKDAVLYCNPEDIHDIEMVMRNVILHEHVRDELRRRGKNRAQNFSWEKFVEKLFGIIENF